MIKNHQGRLAALTVGQARADNIVVSRQSDRLADRRLKELWERL